MRQHLLIFSSLFLCILLAGCGQDQFDNLSAFDGSSSVSIEDVQTEESKEEIISQLKTGNTTEVDKLIANNFPFVDTANGENTTANIYATDKFEVKELAGLLEEIDRPDEISDYIDNQQIMIYPDYFVILKESEELNDVVFIEVATDEFVRNNYSPNFLSTYFAIRILDDVLDVDDWGKKRRSACQSGGCYGGYTSSQSYNKGKTTNSTSRGMSSFRGGGTSSGK
ncbi:protein of unknown function [Gracilibacillus ureilyticus]|uniref:DUF4247 domain-containing protein n=1 Tax=Gracilibacillus ureilyticus TaxID=531814 RepID=A0A1H9UD49_9BACI|nr:DUF4247 domain-containing protein [Gracilibacillus ureilyticus]SES07366.1 protein of unknown function [Gracilibacillus ureilyticus]